MGNLCDIEVNESVFIVVSFKNGSNLEFVFDFNDGGELMVIWRYFVDYKFNFYFYYVVNVIVWNNVSEEFVLLKVKVVKLVFVFWGFLFCIVLIVVNDLIKIVFYLWEGLDFFCIW